MTKKRRNNGRCKHGRGHVKRVRCESSGALVPKDKAVKRFIVRDLVETSVQRDLLDAVVVDGTRTIGHILPKFIFKVYYSISAALHSRIRRVRSRQSRRIRVPCRRNLFDDNKKQKT